MLLRADEGWVRLQSGPPFEIALKREAVGWEEK